jgi:putative DNA primase/helicase
LLTQSLNDSGNAGRLLAVHGKNLLYVSKWKQWLGWDGKRWLLDEKDKIRSLARDALIRFGKEALDAGNKELIRFAVKSLDSGSISNAIREACDQRAILPEELDSDRDLLNFQNGTLSLRTLKLREHKREDLITKLIHCDYNENAGIPKTILGFIETVVSEDQRPLLYRAIGYTLTGHTSEKCTFVSHGPTNCGKTTLLDLLSEHFLKEYSTLIMADSLMQHAHQDSNTLSDLADLCGRRLVQTSETRENQKMDEATLKRVTPGQGMIRAVRKYQLPFQFSPTHKMWIDTNHAVVATATGDDLWGRIVPFEFGPRIEDNKIDRDLMVKLRKEMEGFFLFFCAQAQLWYEKGLGKMPDKVTETRKTWKASPDRVRRFLEECCDVVGVAMKEQRWLIRIQKSFLNSGWSAPRKTFHRCRSTLRVLSMTRQ